MNDKIAALKAHVTELSANPEFVHHRWFVKWHLEVAERIARELLAHYPEADAELVEAMIWMHDYGKIVDFANQYDRALVDKGRDKMIELGFAPDFANRIADYVELQDKNQTEDLHKAPIEVQIVASADGCSHLVGPFFSLYWYENPDKSIDELLEAGKKKLDKDWNRKIVLPEARAGFEKYHQVMLQAQAGELPESFLNA